jgi:paraquat-inducible protein A
VVLAAAAFVLGGTLPVVRLTSAYAGKDLHSLASLLWALHGRGETVLWVGLLALGVVLPGLRLVYLLALAGAAALPAAVRTAAVFVAGTVGGYAIADTMLLLVMLFYLAALGQADAALQPGVYFLAASAGLTLGAYAWANLPTSAASASGQPSSLNDRLAALGAKEAGKT